MIAEAEIIKRETFALLRDWCDALLRLQIDAPADPALHGGILCPACGRVHGRCHEAVFPLMCMASASGDKSYLDAAKKLFIWGENMVCADGAVRNDAASEWKGVTVFAAVALHDALYEYGGLLAPEEKAQWERRLRGMGDWLYENLRPELPAYINYYASNACAMALLGRYFDRGEYIKLSRALAVFCLRHVSGNQLIYGEGRPTDACTSKGCYAVDAGGYNAEETLPMLYRYALESGDNEALTAVRKLFRAHLEWMLPDGAWDDSTGTRGFKWTYWGSRTTDGCQEALFGLGRTEPVFAEAALRNLQLYRRCTHDGLLYGGPDYYAHGEPACVHHTFCHAKTLAAALENGLPDFERCPLPAETAPVMKYYPESDTYRIACGGWIADVTGCDFPAKTGCHASGGAITLLWHKKTGPLIAVGAVDHALREPHNQQQPVKPEETRSTCPRTEAEINGILYAQHYDFEAEICSVAENGIVCVKVNAGLCDAQHVRIPANGECALEYRFSENALTVTGSVSPAVARKTRFVVPLIGDNAKIKILRGKSAGESVPAFHLNPGFLFREYGVAPDENGCFSFVITPGNEGAAI